jgi:hypothetical protein
MRVGHRLTRQLDALVDRTPAERDRYIDLLRVVSLGVVIVWHWSLSILYWTNGQIVMPNPIDAVPGGWLATWLLQVVPIFFLVGGFVNGAAWWSAQRSGTGLRGYLPRRLQRLLVPLFVFALVWAVVEVIAHLTIAGYPGVLSYGQVVFTPLWFVAAYIWVVLVTPITATFHRRARWQTLGVLVTIMVIFDAGRFGLGLDVFGWLNTALVWVVIHQLGYFIRDGFVEKIDGAGVAGLIGVALLTLVLITALGPYPRSMVAVPGQAFSNIYPTTMAIFAVAVLQLGVLIAVRQPMTNWLRHRDVYRPVVAVNAVIMTIFVWHMTAVLIVLAIVRMAGIELLTEPTAAWWLQRPLWVVFPAAVLLIFVAIFGRFEMSPQLGGKRFRN